MAEQLRVALAISLTGQYAPMGTNAYRGLQLWAEEARPGGRPIVLVVRDDGSEPTRVRRELETLLDEQHIELIVGPYSSVLTRAAARVAEERGVVLWNHGGSADDIYCRGHRYVVGIPSSASRYMVPALRTVRTGAVLVLSRRQSGFSAAVVHGVEEEATRQQRTVRFEPYPETLEEEDALSARLGNTPTGLVIGAGRFSDDVELARALRRRHVDVPVALVAAGIGRFGEVFDAADGLLGPSQWEPGAPIAPDVGPTPRQFAHRFCARFGVAPDYPAAQAYAAGLIMGCCVELAKGTDQQALRAAAERLTVTTSFGRFRIDPATGEQIGHEMLLVRWERGERRVIA